MPLLVQHSLISGKTGAVLDGVLFVSSTAVRERSFNDGKLLPCALNDVTVISYIVNGLRFSTVVEFPDSSTCQTIDPIN